MSDRYGSPGLMNVSNCTRYGVGISPMDMVFECFLIVLLLSFSVWSWSVNAYSGFVMFVSLGSTGS